VDLVKNILGTLIPRRCLASLAPNLTFTTSFKVVYCLLSAQLYFSNDDASRSRRSLDWVRLGLLKVHTLQHRSFVALTFPNLYLAR
jgi:hypothetical protein